MSPRNSEFLGCSNPENGHEPTNHEPSRQDQPGNVGIMNTNGTDREPSAPSPSTPTTCVDSGLAKDAQEEDISAGFFEGVEKLLEVWFTTKSSEQRGHCDLRRIPRKGLESLLRKVKCEIVSSMSNGTVDSYVLSESSLFVSQRRIVLKTCGTTTPLHSLQELIELAKQHSGFNLVEDIFYSRKNFERPELQEQRYQHFDREVQLLDEVFADGAAYCMGSLNSDCWYFYTLNPLDRVVRGIVDTEEDQTIEILMTGLDQEVMSIFSTAVSKDGREATKLSGIDKILPQMKIDDFLFNPCGYSMNGILKKHDDDHLGQYMTIHVTPEPHCSYVSFETNVPLRSYLVLIKTVLSIFKPAKFTLNICANKTSIGVASHKELHECQQYGDWIRKDIQYCSMQNYELTYAHFTRFPS